MTRLYHKKNSIKVFFQWILLLILLFYPAKEIVTSASFEISNNFLSTKMNRLEPLDSKTPLSQILNAIGTENNIFGAKHIFDKEYNKLDQDVQRYLKSFFELYEKFSRYKLTINDFIDAKYFITGSSFITKYFDKHQAKPQDIFNAKQIIPITVIKMVYRASTEDFIGETREKAKTVLVDLSEQFLKTIIGPSENMNINGAIALCVIIQTEYEFAAGGFLKSHNKTLLTNLITKIDVYKDMYETALGKDDSKAGTLVEYQNFIKSVRTSADQLKNEDTMTPFLGNVAGAIHRIARKTPGIAGFVENYDIQRAIPGIAISRYRITGGM